MQRWLTALKLTGLGLALVLLASPQLIGDVVYSARGILLMAQGGTGLTSAADDTTLVSSGTAWVAKAIADCDDSGGNHLNYDTGTNAFSCGTSSSSSGANTALSNLASVAINTTLVSDTAATDDLGSSAVPWKALYLRGGVLNVTSTGAGNVAYFNVPLLTLTGADNLVIGTLAGTAMTTDTNSIYIGNNVGDAAAGETNNTIIGQNAGTGSAIGSANTCVGAACLDATTGAGTDGNTCIGNQCLGAVTGGDNNTAIGDGACASVSTGTGNICIGETANVTGGTLDSRICIGRNCTVASANTMEIGGNGAGITALYIGEGDVDATPAGVLLASTGGTGTDIAGASLTITGGRGTGAGLGGALILQTSRTQGTGTTQATLQNRDYVYAGTKALSAGAATDVVRVAVAQDTDMAGGIFQFCVRANDANEEQLRCGISTFAVVNDGGTETCTIGNTTTSCASSSTPDDCTAVTLTATLTCTSAAADTVDIEINAASGLTETTLDAEWRLMMNYGQGAVTPQ